MAEWCRMYPETRRCPIAGCESLPCARLDDDDESRWALDVATWGRAREHEWVFLFATEDDGRRAAAFIDRVRLTQEVTNLGPHEYLYLGPGGGPAPRDVAGPGTAPPQSSS